MTHLTPQEGACIWLIHREFITEDPDDVIHAFRAICERSNFHTDRITKMAETYVSGLNKLNAYMRSSVDPRSLFEVIDGGRKDPEPR